MLDHVTDAGKSDSWRDVITSIVQTSNFVVLNDIAVNRVMISDRQRETACGKKRKESLLIFYKEGLHYIILLYLFFTKYASTS
jgi:hypothetical protein